MLIRTVQGLLATGLLAVAGVSHAGMATITGSLDTTDPQWNGCGSSLATGCYYDFYEFTVTLNGAYNFNAFYPGDTSIDENLDGIIEIYQGSFDPTQPGVNAIGFDDDGPGGSNTSQILGLGLTAGTTYIYVQSSFSDVATSFGQPTGPYEMTIDGPGDINVGNGTDVPAPGMLFLLVSGLFGLGLLRRI